VTPADLLADAFERIRDSVHHVLDGITSDDLAFRPDPEANSIGWLVWHLTRIQDDHVCGVAGTEQLWTSSGWAPRCALPFDDSDTGYAHNADQVGSVTVDAETLRGYHDAVSTMSLTFVRGLADADLDRIVDTNWDPPVTMGVRLVSVITDDLEHAGQAAYLRGLVDRR
jgi:hypothetical protein